MFPPKIKKNDEIRVVAPSRSLSLYWITQEIKDAASQRFREIGLNLSYGLHVNERNEFNSSSIESRVDDIHRSFEDSSVKLIITAIGGYNSNEILPFLDYDLIKANPKCLCGYSDITALINAIYSKTGLITYSGPHFFNFGEKKGFEYTLEYFKKCLFNEGMYEIKPSPRWSDDRWSRDQENRRFIENEGYKSLNEGQAEGTIIGGNLVTFHSLSGTPFFPSLTESILFIEEDNEETLFSINRNLTSLTLNPNFSGVQGIVIGRFKVGTNITFNDLLNIIKNNRKLRNIPVIADVDFGHTSPMITFPIGGKARIIATHADSKIDIIKH